MTRPDPFLYYSLILRAIVYAVIPAFTVWQYVRLRRALHVFQLEGYKRPRFLTWCRRNPRRALFVGGDRQKKPLVMTGRAWRILITATFLSAIAVLLPPAAAHLAVGAPYDLLVWGVVTAAVSLGAPFVLTAADVLLAPVQRAINNRYLAAARRKLDDIRPTVIGVTGSYGKTSTKFAIERLVAPPGAALATPGSFNTPLGVCRTINERLDPSHRFFIVEMGAHREGDIAELCRFARPTVGVLTAIGPAHLERFGSMEAIRRAKYEIVDALPADGVAVMNVDDARARQLADATSHVAVLRYGVDPAGQPDVTATDLEITAAGTAMTLSDGRRSLRAQTRLLGRHSVGHVLGGVAVATALGRGLEELKEPLEELEPPEHRLQLVTGTSGVTVIDDAYSSNPDGAAAALEVLEAMPGNRKLLVTPGMVELGELQHEQNERFAERASKVADTVIVVGRTNRDALVTGAARGPAEVVVVDSLAQATQRLASLLQVGDVVLFENDLPDQYEG